MAYIILSIENLLTFLLTEWSRILLEKLTGSQLVKKFPALYGTRRFITAFTSARPLSLSWASSIQSMSTHPTSLNIYLNIILPFTSGSSKWSLSLRFSHQNLVYTYLYSPPYVLHISPTSIHLDFITRKILGEKYGLFNVHKPNCWLPCAPLHFLRFPLLFERWTEQLICIMWTTIRKSG